nr:hypothetical protein [uncultured Desulfobulbus sp.]
MAKTVDLDAVGNLFPAIMLDQSGDNLLKRYTMQGVIGLLIVHPDSTDLSLTGLKTEKGLENHVSQPTFAEYPLSTILSWS